MILATSWTLVVVRTAGRVAITAATRTSLTSLPSAIAWATSVSVMMPAGLPARASTTRRAVVPACFIRYAAAATWSCWPTVVSGGRMTSATVAVAARAGIHVFRAETLAMVCFISGLLTCGLAITLCLVGVSEVTGPPPESRLRVCLPAAVRPARVGWCGGGSRQRAMDQGNGGRAFADRRSDPFDRSAAHVTGGEHPGQAGLQRQRQAAGGPAVAGARGQVESGADEPLPVAGDGLAEPFGARLGADENEQSVRGDGAPRPGGGALQYQRFEMAGAVAGAAGDLHPVADVDVRGVADLADEVVGHASRQRGRADQDGHLLGPSGQVQRGLPGGVGASNDEHVPPAHGRCLAGRGAVEHPSALQLLQGRDAQPPVGDAGRDDHGARGQHAPVGQAQPVMAAVYCQARGLPHVQERGTKRPGLLPG